jgi:hypothetical protein
VSSSTSAVLSTNLSRNFVTFTNASSKWVASTTTNYSPYDWWMRSGTNLDTPIRHPIDVYVCGISLGSHCLAYRGRGIPHPTTCRTRPTWCPGCHRHHNNNPKDRNASKPTCANCKRLSHSTWRKKCMVAHSRRHAPPRKLHQGTTPRY